MRKPVAKPRATSASPLKISSRSPKAFAPESVTPDPVKLEEWTAPEPAAEIMSAPMVKKTNWAVRLLLSAGGLLFSLALALTLERLVRDLFARFSWLGWLGSAALLALVVALFILAVREYLALRRLNNLDDLRLGAEAVLQNNLPEKGRVLIARLHRLYLVRPDLARARQRLDAEVKGQFDGADMINLAERHLMKPLDARARTLTAASARRVAIVTAISPRALVDILFVAYESMKLTRAIATLYGARPGLFGGLRLARAILSHLAITGGVALGDSVIQQLLGHGLAAKLSARLGEGLVNGLMTVRVGIAAMRVTRPLPFDQLKQPQVIDFATELANITRANKVP